VKYDVLVCGAGPVGLMLAAELRLHHLSVLVVDRLAGEPDSTVRAGSITTPTAEAFYRRGLLPALEAVQQQIFEHMRTFLQASMPAGWSAAMAAGAPCASWPVSISQAPTPRSRATRPL
jgi:2-polyprenyl-6-methoxyphenol hydroxylase-like FAD-dependent oxidoreductase